MKTSSSLFSEEDEDDFKNGYSTNRLPYSLELFRKTSLLKSTIRKINPTNPEDMRRVVLIDKNPKVLKYMVGEPLHGKEFLEFITDTKDKTLYGVVGSGLVPPEEKNKLQGWIMVYSGKEVTRRAIRALERRVMESHCSVLEISYAKYPNALPGQIANGLRQVLLEIARRDGIDLADNDFTYKRLVTAYSDSGNIKSRHVLEAAGFVLQKKKTLWDPKESKKKDSVYLLDWQKLRQKFLSLFKLRE